MRAAAYKPIMEMPLRQMFEKNFLDAASKEAAAPAVVETLNELKTTLKEDFEQEFGPNALTMYYLGKIKRPVYDEDDKIVRKSDGTKKLATKDFGMHFPHEILADELGINFLKMHTTILQPYFMAVAMHEFTGNNDYDMLARDLLDNVITTAKENIREGYPDLTEMGLTRIVDAISFSVTMMIQHKKPLSLELADQMPTDRDPEPPPLG